MKKFLFFDLDGVLIDTRFLHFNCFQQALREFGVSLSKEYHTQHLEGLPTFKKLNIIQSTYNLEPELIERIQLRKQQLTLQYLSEFLGPQPQLIQFLENLKNKNYQLALCTNSRRETLELIVEKLKISSFFEVILCADDVDAPKPDPAIYQRAQQKFSAQPQECLIFEDSEHGISAAKNAGIDYIRLHSPEELHLELLAPFELLLFIPTYRCEKQISRVIKQLQPDVLKYFKKVLCIDNQSPDNTFQATKLAIEQTVAPFQKSLFEVIKNPQNLGLGGSHKVAFQYALDHGLSGVIILHGDDQGSLQDFPFTELQKGAKGIADSFLWGARFHPQSTLVGYNKFRIFGNICFNILASLLYRRKIYDLGGSGLNYFPCKYLKLLPFHAYSQDLTFHIYVLLGALKISAPMRFFPISWREDDQISNVKLFSQAFKVLRILLSGKESRTF